ncbi:MAG: hypothetical protein AM325_007765 [Candidatus Thorarchaeota archaeon SMTZ1-45]|nr:MAG: hypothetical protein AM325_09490 [Candidatus Thorarchaeota archaeon SMTZ1-45]
MVDKLGVQEFMVLTSGGTPIFHFSNVDKRKLDELLSGFLSAITSFATEFGEKSIQRLSFEGSELLYEQFGTDYLFIFLVESGSSEKVLRVVLRELTNRFVFRYQSELKMDIPVLDVFMDFENDVRGVFSYYEGILVVMSSLSAFVIPEIKKNNLDNAIKTGGFLDEFHRDLGSSGNRVLSAIDGMTSIYDISRNLGLSETEISEIIEYLAIRGLLRVSKLCPLLHEKDSRFDAYLDLIGLPSKDYQLLDRAKSLCNGDRSLVDVSERLGVVPEQLYEVLEKLGDEVEWRLVEVTGLIDELEP